MITDFNHKLTFAVLLNNLSLILTFGQNFKIQAIVNHSNVIWYRETFVSSYLNPKTLFSDHLLIQEKMDLLSTFLENLHAFIIFINEKLRLFW